MDKQSSEMDVDAAVEEELALGVIEERDNSEEMDTNARSDRPSLPPLAQSNNASSVISKSDMRSISVPTNRRTPLKANWAEIRKLLVETLLLDVRYNVRKSAVQIRNGKETKDPGSLQKGEDFVKAFVLGFELKDSIALIRLDELYMDSFEITDVKNLHGDHLSRAIGRIAGHVGKMKNALENACRTRIVLADKTVHLLGTYNSVIACKSSICRLIMGRPASKIFGNLRGLAARASRVV